MLIFKVLHILSMFTMVTVFIGGEFLYAFAIWRRDVRALGTLHRLEAQSRLPFVGVGALFAGIAFGLLTAATGGFDFFAGWLIAAYVLVALFFVNVAVLGRGVVRIGEAAGEAEAGERPVEDVVRDMAASRGVLFFAIDAVIFVAIIADMVLKPF
jgi:predicted integral membrane protein DUF2269